MPPTINLLSPQVAADPFPTYAELRQQWPACPIEPGGFYAVSRYHDVSRVLKDFRLFSSTGFQKLFEPPWIEYNPMAHCMLVMNPPEHTRLRKLVNRAFTTSALGKVERLLRNRVDEFTGALAEQGESDFVATFAAPVPGHVICFFLDLDVTQAVTFKGWIDGLAGITPAPRDDDHARETLAMLGDMQTYFSRILDERRSRPGDDLVSQLIAAEVEGQSLSDSELMSFLFLLLAGGIDTTVHLISKSMIVLSDRPDLWQRLRQDPALIPAFVDEVLRYEPPAHALFRQATQDVDVSGTTVPGGAFVMALVASANRDPEKFPEPDQFDIDRASAGGLAFGGGPHACIGAALARLEARTSLAALVQRFSAVERVNQDIDWHHTLTIRGPASLPMRFIV